MSMWFVFCRHHESKLFSVILGVLSLCYGIAMIGLVAPHISNKGDFEVSWIIALVVGNEDGLQALIANSSREMKDAATQKPTENTVSMGYTTVMLVLVSGIVIFVAAIMLLVGAWKRSSCLLWPYIIISVRCDVIHD